MILVNGERTEIAASTTVRALLDVLDIAAQGRGVAVAVDAQVVARSEWDTYELADGARVEIVHAVAGG